MRPWKWPQSWPPGKPAWLAHQDSSESHVPLQKGISNLDSKITGAISGASVLGSGIIADTKIAMKHNKIKEPGMIKDKNEDDFVYINLVKEKATRSENLNTKKNIKIPEKDTLKASKRAGVIKSSKREKQR